MAGIDKIYGTIGQYDQLHHWLTNNYPEGLQYLYERKGYHNQGHRPISNFPSHIDMQMLENCPLDFVVTRIKEQYGELTPKEIAEYKVIKPEFDEF